MTTHVAIVNPVWTAGEPSAEALLNRYRTLTGWATAAAAAGVKVSIIQRWRTDGTLAVGGIPVHLVADGEGEQPTLRAESVARCVRAVGATVVHLNGVVFSQWTGVLRRALPADVPLLVQDHGGWHPGGASMWARRRVRRTIAASDGVLLASPGQIAEWTTLRVIPPDVPAHDVMEASSDFSVCLAPKASRHRVSGSPSVVWVGRLSPLKDPLTAIEGFLRFREEAPDARLTMIGPGGELAAKVARRVHRVDAEGVVQLVSAVRHEELEGWLQGADVFLSSSLAEGSGYAALEAMACGTVPVLTAIGSFLAMTDGRVGHHWRPGDADSCAEALARAAAACGPEARGAVRKRFDDALAWPAIGRRAAEIYRTTRVR